MRRAQQINLNKNIFNNHKRQKIMNKEIETLKENGFKGFKTVAGFDVASLPATGGVYVVIRDKEEAPEFLEVGTGGFFRGNPNVSVGLLQSRYLGDTNIVYIGKSNNLKSRIKQLLRFGAGEAVGHYGGRYLWQLKDSADLIIAWKETPLQDPRQVEKEMLRQFEADHGALPFANLVH